MADKITRQQVISYYDECDIDYKLVWDLDNSYAMHFGYWDEGVSNIAEALKRENEILADMLGVKSSDTILDAGCGVGGSSIYLAKRYGCKVIGITLSGQQAKQATKNAARNGVAQNTDFLAMDFENMSFPKERFDVIWAVESVCHADDKEAFIRAAFKILKPGGRIVIADGFSTKEHYTGTEKATMQKWLNGWGVNEIETTSMLSKYLAGCGFQKVSFVNITHNVLPSSKRLYRYSFPALFVGKIAELLKIRTKTQTGNIIAARNQYLALRQSLWEYQICYAEKPSRKTSRAK